MSLLSHIATLIDCNYSSSKVLIEKRLRLNIQEGDEYPELLMPQWPNFEPLWEREEYRKDQQQITYHLRQSSELLKPLESGTCVG